MTWGLTRPRDTRRTRPRHPPFGMTGVALHRPKLANPGRLFHSYTGAVDPKPRMSERWATGAGAASDSFADAKAQELQPLSCSFQEGRETQAREAWVGASSLKDRMSYSPVVYSPKQLDRNSMAEKQRYIRFGKAAEASSKPVQSECLHGEHKGNRIAVSLCHVKPSELSYVDPEAT